MLLENKIASYWRRVDRRSRGECWPWLGCKSTKGYGLIMWDGKQQNAHRIAWLLANGIIPDGLHCLHFCDNPECQNPAHLFLGTNQENIADKVRKGRQRGARGESSGSAKLTETDVRHIRQLYLDQKSSLRKLAKEFGVRKQTIEAIVYQRTWKHLLPEE